MIILVAIYLVIAPVINKPNILFLFATLLILFGLVFYYPFVYRKRELDFMSKKINLLYNNLYKFFFCFLEKINNFLMLFFDLRVAQVNI